MGVGVMRRNEKRPQVLADQKGAKFKASCTSLVVISTRQVNHLRLLAVVQFRNIIIAGIALAGWPECPWLSRLVDRLTVLAEALAEKSGVRA